MNTRPVMARVSSFYLRPWANPLLSVAQRYRCFVLWALWNCGRRTTIKYNCFVSLCLIHWAPPQWKLLITITINGWFCCQYTMIARRIPCSIIPSVPITKHWVFSMEVFSPEQRNCLCQILYGMQLFHLVWAIKFDWNVFESDLKENLILCEICCFFICC